MMLTPPARHTEPLPPLPADPEVIAANSFFDFHAKGLNYVCLHRSVERTLKVYFLPETRGGIVLPHDHLYSFTTRLLAGEVVDQRYCAGSIGAKRDRLEWHSVLRGGDGFRRTGQVRRLRPTGRMHARAAGTRWATDANTIHTLKPRRWSIIELVQGPTIKTVSHTYQPAGAKLPNLDGLYRKPSVDEVLARLRTLAALGFTWGDAA